MEPIDLYYLIFGVMIVGIVVLAILNNRTRKHEEMTKEKCMTALANDLVVSTSSTCRN